MAKFRILSLDGGGIRGIITAILLQRLSAQEKFKHWLDSVDLIAGTSTGGLLALGLARGLELQQIRDLYEAKGARVFSHSPAHDLFGLWQLTAAKYDNQNLERELINLLGQTTLAQLNKRVLITSFDLDNAATDPKKRTWKPKIFHNFPGDDSDGALLAYKVGLYTSAAPTYFPSADGFVDGGVFANNPSMCALAQTQDERIGNRPAFTDIVLLSVGTGTSLDFNPGLRLDWGLAQWAKPIITLILDGVSGVAHYQCEKLLNERYCRLAPTFDPGVVLSLDSVNEVSQMITFANQVDLAPTIAWMEKQWLTD